MKGRVKSEGCDHSLSVVFSCFFMRWHMENMIILNPAHWGKHIILLTERDKQTRDSEHPLQETED